MGEPLRLTAAQIEAGKTKAGGWTYKQLREWGVPIPPPKGWRQALLRGAEIPIERDRKMGRQELAFRAGFKAAAGGDPVDQAWDKYRALLDDINAQRQGPADE